MASGSSPRRATRSAKKGMLFALLVIALSVASFAASGLVASGTPSGDVCNSTSDNTCCAGGSSVHANDTTGCNPCDTSGGEVSSTDNSGDNSGCNPCQVPVLSSTDGSGGSSDNIDKCWTNTTSVIAEGDPGTDITNSSAPLGTTVHDEATVANPLITTTEDGGDGGDSVTQNMNFTLFPGHECSGDPLSNEDVNISAPETVSSGSQTLPAGDYSYLATYTRTKSDVEDTSSDGPSEDGPVVVTAACEPFTISPVDPNVSTTILDSTDTTVTSAALGTQVRDTASVSGLEGFDPTGTVSFDFFTGSDCSGEPVAAGSADVVKGVADGSDLTDPLAAGSYSYLAHYSGDSNYNALDAQCENLTIETAASTTATVITDSNGGKYANGDLFPNNLSAIDTAQVSSTNESFVPTGTVQFDFFQNNNCSGTPVDAGSIDLGKTAGAASLPQTLTTAAGGSFIAHYSGDSNFVKSDGTCEFVGTDDVLGLFVVKQTAPPAEVAAALAFTGGNSTPWAIFGALLVGLGGLVLLATRRRGGATSS